ncbi:MAG: hypothetical protein ACOH1R_02680 [Luteimonas sp.]
MTLTFTLLTIAILAAVLGLLLRRRSRRQRVLGQLLDAADGLEERLRTARAELDGVMHPGGMGSDANPVRDALQEMLRQRLWLQQQGADASLDQLCQVRDSIDAARQRIDHQLLAVERARAPSH